MIRWQLTFPWQRGYYVFVICHREIQDHKSPLSAMGTTMDLSKIPLQVKYGTLITGPGEVICPKK